MAHASSSSPTTTKPTGPASNVARTRRRSATITWLGRQRRRLCCRGRGGSRGECPTAAPKCNYSCSPAVLCVEKPAMVPASMGATKELIVMYDYSRGTPYTTTDYGAESALGTQRSAILGKVLGLLGFAFVFTAGGAVIGRSLGPGAFFISMIGSFGTLIALQFLRERAPLNLLLLYSFATFEGMLLGMILDLYIRS